MNIKSDDGPRRERNIALALVGLFILEKEGRPYDTAALDAFISLVFTRSAYNARDNASGKNHASGNKHHHGRIAAPVAGKLADSNTAWIVWSSITEFIVYSSTAPTLTPSTNTSTSENPSSAVIRKV